uniref:Uncharacterized protein n=1 Tax=Arundo donax TaxID=35708 RepID=A0A0A9EAM4_ARUDO
MLSGTSIATARSVLQFKHWQIYTVMQSNYEFW